MRWRIRRTSPQALSVAASTVFILHSLSTFTIDLEDNTRQTVFAHLHSTVNLRISESEVHLRYSQVNHSYLPTYAAHGMTLSRDLVRQRVVPLTDGSSFDSYLCQSDGSPLARPFTPLYR